jgi:ribosomal protein S18 acetylase RimI-like enzyme
MDERLRFETIDVQRHGDVCVRFRRDSYACSFGDASRFDLESGEDGARYLAWLRQRVSEWPEGAVHVWVGDRIIGQLEMRIRGEERTGYVNLFYLAPEERGTGKGAALHWYAVEVFRRSGVKTVQLSVAPSNVQAIRYYQKHGWVDLGTRPGHEDVHLMELRLV